MIEKRELMLQAYKPENYNTVSPYLIVDGANRTIEFLKTVFGASELRRFEDAAGFEGWPPIPSRVHIYVNDVDTIYRQALEAGAISVQEPVKKEDEDRRGGVKDAGGTTWWIATKVE